MVTTTRKAHCPQTTDSGADCYMVLSRILAHAGTCAVQWHSIIVKKPGVTRGLCNYLLLLSRSGRHSCCGACDTVAIDLLLLGHQARSSTLQTMQAQALLETDQ